MSLPLPKYPLEEVLDIKKRRVTDAEKVVKQKEQALEVEKEKLLACEKARDAVKDHLAAKHLQLREEFDHGTTSPKIRQMKAYIDVVKERLAAEEKKVDKQKEQVEVAEKNLSLARHDLMMRRKEQDKIETHKVEWKKEAKIELELQETREEDEIGTTMFLSKLTLKKTFASKKDRRRR